MMMYRRHKDGPNALWTVVNMGFLNSCTCDTQKWQTGHAWRYMKHGVKRCR